jgi:hypothetical protein
VTTAGRAGSEVALATVRGALLSVDRDWPLDERELRALAHNRMMTIEIVRSIAG